MEKNKVFTTQELAGYLKLNEKTIIKMAQNGHLPGVKIGSQWRFHLKAIDNFLLKGMSEAPEEELDSVIDTDIDIIPLSRLTDYSLIELNSKADSRKVVIERLAEIAHRQGLTPSREKLLGELNRRESFLSTAVGGGIAIPHPRHPSPDFFGQSKIIILISREGIDYDAPDKRPVQIFFMPCVPDEHTHIRLLARISKFFHQPEVVEKLVQAENKDQVLSILLRFDREYMYAGDRI